MHFFFSTKRNKVVPYIYLANLLLAFHYYLVIYINSTFLEGFFSKSGVGNLYILGAAISLLMFLEAPRFLRRFGNAHYLLAAIVLEFLATLGMAFADSPTTAGLFFVLHTGLITMIAFSLDIFLEGAMLGEEDTGETRAIFLTLGNTILVIAPLIVGLLAFEGNFTLVYITSAIFCIPLLSVVFKDLRVPDQGVDHIGLKDSIAEVGGDKNLRNVSWVQLVLQIFYAWMVIYMPIYLHEYVGFSWQQLGMMFAIMLLPFILFEIPVGYLADKKWGEKEFMFAGFAIIALAMFLVPFIATKSFILWTALLFLSRTGASFIEITAESFFFKHVRARNVSIISLFRMTRPIAYILVPLILGVFLKLVNFSVSFFILAVIILFGINFVRRIVDTK